MNGYVWKSKQLVVKKTRTTEASVRVDSQILSSRFCLHILKRDYKKKLRCLFLLRLVNADIIIKTGIDEPELITGCLFFLLRDKISIS